MQVYIFLGYYHNGKAIIFFGKEVYSRVCKSVSCNQFLLQKQIGAVIFEALNKRNQTKGRLTKSQERQLIQKKIRFDGNNRSDILPSFDNLYDLSLFLACIFTRVIKISPLASATSGCSCSCTYTKLQQHPAMRLCRQYKPARLVRLAYKSYFSANEQYTFSYGLSAKRTGH